MVHYNKLHMKGDSYFMNIKYHRINESELSSLPFNEGSMYFCKDTGKLYADPIGGGVHTF